jgi:hypothetical protein
VNEDERIPIWDRLREIQQSVRMIVEQRDDEQERPDIGGTFDQWIDDEEEEPAIESQLT